MTFEALKQKGKKTKDYIEENFGIDKGDVKGVAITNLLMVFVPFLWILLSNYAEGKSVYEFFGMRDLEKERYELRLDSIEQAELMEEKMLIETNQHRRDSMQNVVDSTSVIDGIRLGMTKAEYDKAIASIHKSIGTTIEIEDKPFSFSYPEFYKNRLYSFSLIYHYTYSVHRRNYNDKPLYNPTPFVDKIVNFYVSKYGTYDNYKSYDRYTNGDCNAVCHYAYWIFNGKTIHIGNTVEEHSGSYDYGSFTIEIKYYNTATYKLIREQEEAKKKRQEEEGERRQRELEQRRKKMTNSL